MSRPISEITRDLTKQIGLCAFKRKSYDGPSTEHSPPFVNVTVVGRDEYDGPKFTACPCALHEALDDLTPFYKSASDRGGKLRCWLRRYWATDPLQFRTFGCNLQLTCGLTKAQHS